MNDRANFRPPEPFSPEASDDADFANEHNSISVDDLDGGPERVPEPESPHGHAGMD